MSVFASDPALLGAFRSGERAALTTVYYHYVDDVMTLIRYGTVLASSGVRVRGVTDDAGARDLVQEVFIRAFAPRARAAYDGIHPYRAYLLRIARNLMIDRARAVDPTIPLEHADEALALAAPSEDEHAAEWAAQRRLASSYIAELPAQLRALVKLRFEDELSQEETAAALQISRRRVRTLEARVQRGLRRALLRAELQQKDRPG